ncbi:hypothetical protein LCGC14_0764320 [marine sediment metagenome]|uniref:Uncharacterized protein n=1 Tax=marine sediment metagenome TaxID=412755 RepID=A0A0F9T792_9ZZZZ
MFKSEGRLIYNHTGDKYKLIVAVDKNIVEYYRRFVPKSIGLKKTKFNPHITVVRNEKPTYLFEWRDDTDYI